MVIYQMGGLDRIAAVVFGSHRKYLRPGLILPSSVARLTVYAAYFTSVQHSVHNVATKASSFCGFAAAILSVKLETGF